MKSGNFYLDYLQNHINIIRKEALDKKEQAMHRMHHQLLTHLWDNCLWIVMKIPFSPRAELLYQMILKIKNIKLILLIILFWKLVNYGGNGYGWKWLRIISYEALYVDKVIQSKVLFNSQLFHCSTRLINKVSVRVLIWVFRCNKYLSRLRLFVS